MNILFLSLDRQDCIQTWSENTQSTYNWIKEEHSVTWIGRDILVEVEEYHKTIYKENIPFIFTEYKLLFSKLLSNLINQSCYDLVVCCENTFTEYLTITTPTININNAKEWTKKYIQNLLSSINLTIKTYVPIYVINMKEREDRRQSIVNEFKGKPEFDLHLIDACVHQKGTIGLWNSIVRIIQTAKEFKEDFVIICEDDHFFTKNYSPSLIIREIQEAALQRAEILSGGIGGFGHGFPVGFRRYWVDWFWCTQFIVVYASFFDKILSYEFKEDDAADEVISVIAKNKMVIYPFISEQKDFGYSDVTQNNDEQKGLIRRLFNESNKKLKKIEEFNQNKYQLFRNY